MLKYPLFPFPEIIFVSSLFSRLFFSKFHPRKRKIFTLVPSNNRANEISPKRARFPLAESGDIAPQEHDHSVKRTIPCYQNNPKASLIDLSVFPPTFHACVVLVNPPRASNPEEHCFNPLPPSLFSLLFALKGGEGSVKEVSGIPKLVAGNFITLIPRSVIILVQLFKNPRSRGHERRGGEKTWETRFRAR